MNDITLTFGKHKGKTLAECPREYVEWLASLSSCKQSEVPEVARAFLETTPDTCTLYPCCTIEDAEKLAWMAGKGNRKAAATLQAERKARSEKIGNKEGYVSFDGEDGDEVLFFIFEGGTGGYTTSRVEIYEDEEFEAKCSQEEIYKEAHPDLEWTAQSGQQIKIWVDEFYPGYGQGEDIQMYLLSIDGVKKERTIEPVPAGKRLWARQNDIVAVLGPVGLTAERKAILEEKAKANV